ncbi:glutathione S-transferase [Corallincola platygyrae]|uniref:Glutathione S-transferase n=1 Tax=Corallincola platygyrae TaxID=1193278 RepID=A0ABW4XI75_9GAMM
MTALTLYRHPLSGHAHRAELFLSLLGLNTALVDVDLANGEHKSEAFLAKNSFGQVPVLIDGGSVIADSNAILVYLAKTYDDSGRWYPESPSEAAEIQRFLSVASGQAASGPAAARLVNVFGAALDHERAKTISHQLLAVLETHLSGRNWLVGSHATIADVANYTYIAHAPEGDVSLSAYPHVRAWLKRIEQLSGFVPMQATAVGLAAA